MCLKVYVLERNAAPNPDGLNPLTAWKMNGNVSVKPRSAPPKPALRRLKSWPHLAWKKLRAPPLLNWPCAISNLPCKRGILGIVRDHEDGLALPVELKKNLHDLAAGFAVERAGRLVGQRLLHLCDFCAFLWP